MIGSSWNKLQKTHLVQLLQNYYKKPPANFLRKLRIVKMYKEIANRVQKQLEISAC